MLDRSRTQPRKFRRLAPARLTTLLADRGPAEPAPEEPDRRGTRCRAAAEGNGEPPIAP